MRLCLLLSKPEIIKQMQLEKDKNKSDNFIDIDNDTSDDMTSIKYKKDVRNILTQLARKKATKDESQLYLSA